MKYVVPLTILLALGLNAQAVLTPELPLELDLTTAVTFALEANPTLNEARARQQEREGATAAARAARLPSLRADGFYRYDDATAFDDGDDPDEDYWQAAVALYQPLYFGGQLNAGLRSRRLREAAAAREIDDLARRIASEVARSFHRAMIAREEVNTQLETIVFLERQLAFAKARYETGSGPMFDVVQAEVRLANARTPLTRARHRYRAAIDELSVSMGAAYPDGKNADDITLTNSGIRVAEPDISVEEGTRIALEQRSDLAALILEREALTEDMRQTQAQREPEVGLAARYRIESDRYGSDDTTEGWLVGVEATMVLWEGGRIRAEVAQAQSRMHQAEWRESALRLAIERDVREAHRRANEALEIYAGAAETIRQAEEAVRLAENRYEVGSLTALETLAARLELNQARLDYTAAMHEVALALFDLDRAIGRPLFP